MKTTTGFIALMVVAVLLSAVVTGGCDRNGQPMTAEQDNEPEARQTQNGDEETSAAAEPAVNRQAGPCPEDLEMEAVFKHDEIAVVSHDVIVHEDISEAEQIDDEIAEELGRPQIDGSYWVFPRDGGTACRLEPAEPMLIPVLYLEPWHKVVLATRLEGDCEHLDDEGPPGSMPDQPMFTVQAETMSQDCQLQRHQISPREDGDGRELPETLLELRERLEVDGELGCEDDTDECTLHWQLREHQLDNHRRLLIGEAIQVRPFPEDSHVHCRYDIQQSWSSGVILEEDDGQLSKLHYAAWPVVLQLGAEGEKERLLGLTNDQTRLLSWSVDNNQLSEEKTAYQWWQYHEEEMTSELGLQRRFICGP